MQVSFKVGSRLKIQQLLTPTHRRKRDKRRIKDFIKEGVRFYEIKIDVGLSFTMNIHKSLARVVRGTLYCHKAEKWAVSLARFTESFK